MNVLFLVNRFPVISETFVLRQLTSLLDRGHDAQILANSLGDPLHLHSDISRYRLFERTTLLSDFTHLSSAFSPDILHCHFGPTGVLGLLLRDSGVFGGQLLTSFYGYDVTRHPEKYGKGFYRRLFSGGDLFTVTTDSMLEQLEGLGCPKQNIIKHYPAGIDLHRIQFRYRSLDVTRPIRFLTVARLVEKKGITVALQALAKVKAQGYQIEYSIIGEGPLRRQIELLVSELKLQDAVTMHGAKNDLDVMSALLEADIFMLPSMTSSDGDEDPSPIALLEAQAAGLPILSTMHSGIPEIVRDGKSAYLVPEGDQAALADAVIELLNHPESWAGMGHQGRSLVESQFSSDMLGDRLAAIYQKMLGETGDLILRSELGQALG